MQNNFLLKKNKNAFKVNLLPTPFEYQVHTYIYIYIYIYKITLYSYISRVKRSTVKDTPFEENCGIFRFVTLSSEIPDKMKLHP